MLGTMKAAAAFALLLVLAATVHAAEIEFFLRAQTTTKTMPDGVVVPVWGFAQDTTFGAHDGAITVPGPMLTVPPGTDVVRITIENKIPNQPVSIVIPGQIAAAMLPVRHQGLTGAESVLNGRVRSFTMETAPGNTAPVTYTWNNFRAGTFIYHSGTHPSLQVPLGLYGGVKKDEAAGTAYPGVDYAGEVLMFYSEIDPALNNAAVSRNFGIGKATTSTVNYAPKYYLVNGAPYSAATAPIAVAAGVRTLIRFFNAGSKPHTPTLHNHYLTVHAEGGFPYLNPQDRTSVLLPALQTKDTIVTITGPGQYALWDRSLHLTNNTGSPGGLRSVLTAP